jgi:hypothetical protein
MEQARTLLAQPEKIADARAEQRRVITQLDELINQLCKQCQGGSSKPDSPAGKPQQSQQSSAQTTSKAATPGTTPAGAPTLGSRDTSAEQKQPAVGQAQAADRDAMIKRLWGQLPERSREQMRQSISSEFLPKYELELEKYYRRLAEEGDKK